MSLKDNVDWAKSVKNSRKTGFLAHGTWFDPFFMSNKIDKT